MSESAPWRDADLLEELYVEQDLSLGRAAAELDCSRETVKKYLDRYEIGERYPCPSCERVFFARNGAARHHKDEHGETLRELESKEGDIPCPDCEKAFDTQEGLNSHRGLVHDVRIPVECKHCGEIKRFPPAVAEDREYCDEECMAAAYREITGEDHPKFVEKPVLTCVICGVEFEVYPYEADTRATCGATACRYEVQGRRVRGENNHNYKRKEVSCAYCGETLERPPWWADRDTRHFCQGTDCFGDWLSETNSGQDNPCWRGGTNIRDALVKLFPTQWSVARSNARERAEYECEMCGDSESVMVSQLDIHHIIPVLSGGTNGEYNTMALCKCCHKKAESYTRRFLPPVYLAE